jgi:UDP-3-O-[3-hydroxymyristoyl] N-acetylglucosamine deacetylase/3-hydroxyacyl-[acyl-carrier-protein] dehydratase
MEKQRTIEKEVSLKGTGLHTANKVNITFKPQEPDCGINFVRTDLPAQPKVAARLDYLLPNACTLRRTSIGQGEAEIHTIEHLMAALAGLKIDNLLIEMDNNEVPGLDGSSLGFLELLSQAGIKEQEKVRLPFVIKDAIYVEEEGASIVALPAREFKISYTLNYDHPLLKAQFLEVNLDRETFARELASSRTFCLEGEANLLQYQGLGRGASYDNTLVVGKEGVVKNKLRHADEFVRHKILDLLGDLYLLGYPITGHIIALKSGHALNLKMAGKIYQQKKRYTLGGVGSDFHPPASQEMDVEMIMRILPHRHPFLFVDKILHLEKGKKAVGLKHVTINDYFFQGHFPGRPVMPGVLIIEAMAQVGGVMMLSPEENRGKLAYFMSIDNAKFRKTVVPGDELILEVEAGKIKSRTGQVSAKAFVNNKLVAEADLKFVLADV